LQHMACSRSLHNKPHVPKAPCWSFEICRLSLAMIVRKLSCSLGTLAATHV
jgi:hypothetical protein